MKLIPETEILAFDFKSARSRDEDGRLHVEVSNISKANVCPYRGCEIPRWQELGLDAHRVYNLLRDPAELKKAAHTFNRLPILNQHVHVTADSPRNDLIVGASGSDASFQYPYLKNSLVIWKQGAIDGIEDLSQCELSSAYRYDAVMKPGVYEGVAYDGKMVNFRGNHISLVPKGRAGSDVVVGDSSMQRPIFIGLLDRPQFLGLTRR